MNKIVSLSTLAKLYEYFAAQAATLIETGEPLAPQLFFFTLDKEGGLPNLVMVVPGPTMEMFHANAEGKFNMCRAIEELLHGRGPSSFPRVDIALHVSEAWMSSKQDGQGAQRLLDGKVRVCDMKDKEEVVLLSFYSLDGTVIGACPIRTATDSGKKTVEIRPLFTGNDGILVGNLVIDPANKEPLH